MKKDSLFADPVLEQGAESKGMSPFQIRGVRTFPSRTGAIYMAGLATMNKF